jgi:hypothetical protein
VTGVPPAPGPGGVPGPRAELEGVGRLVPLALVRVGVLLAAQVTAATVAVGRPAGWLAAAVVVLGVLAAALPGSAVPGLFAAAVVVVQGLYGGFDVRVVLTAAGLHATWSLCGLAAGTPVRGRIEPAALLPGLHRWLRVTAGTCALAAATWAVRAGGVRVGEQLLLLAGLGVVVAGIAVGHLVGVSPYRRHPRPPTGQDDVPRAARAGQP